MVAGLGTYYLISCPLFFIYYTASHSPSPSLCGSEPRFQKEKAGQSTAGCEKFQQLQALIKCVFKSDKKTHTFNISVYAGSQFSLPLRVKLCPVNGKLPFYLIPSQPIESQDFLIITQAILLTVTEH